MSQSGVVLELTIANQGSSVASVKARLLACLRQLGQYGVGLAPPPTATVLCILLVGEDPPNNVDLAYVAKMDVRAACLRAGLDLINLREVPSRGTAPPQLSP